MSVPNEKKIAIITSASDAAGASIKAQLLRNYGFEKASGEDFDGFDVYSLPIEDCEARLFTIAGESTRYERIDERIAAGMFVFATRHFSKAGIPALTTHSVGNWSRAELGGKDQTICHTSPSLLKLFLQNLAAVAKSEDYTGEVVQESTHHGPYLEKPAVFIEVGSTEQQWKDAHLASMVADSLIGGLGDYSVLGEHGEKHEPVVALGGPHYASNLRKLMLDSQYAIGHICPKHHLQSLTPELLRQAMDSCFPQKAAAVALDWKGLGTEKQRIMQILEGNCIEYFRV